MLGFLLFFMYPESAVLCDGCGTHAKCLISACMVSGKKGELICIVALLACYLIGWL